ncbi:MAG: IS21 family transposase [Candidatus Omnitrophica bacterium]|nr:IS21 family transposase [Candidatus Omnitrophota bacterium]
MKNDDVIIQQVLHLRDVEKLSLRQIAQQIGIDRKRARRILYASQAAPAIVVKKGKVDSFMSLIGEWYSKYPHLQAQQVFERLKNYGYTGGYTSVKLATLEYRQPKETAYHPLVFHPGQEAQVDWFFFNHERMGMVAGFLYVLSYSRYAWGIFYPRSGFEFFLAGHLECYKHLGGLARTQRYDNLKSAVLRRKPQIEYNPQFMDFARFYGFSVHACNPYSGNEKGRVERLIRDIRVFLETESFIDLADLNRKFHAWLERRNNTEHRSTRQTPQSLLGKENLLKLPVNVYLARRVVPARVSKTALVEFETNRYSVPSSCVSKMVDVTAYPGLIEIYLSGQKVATHKRCFSRIQMIQNPLHAERLLDRSPKFQQERVRQLIAGMDPALRSFLEQQEDEDAQQHAAYQIFQLIKTHSRATVLSAVRELNGMNCAKIKALVSLLCVPCVQDPPAVWPKDTRLLTLNYQERKLTDYDPDTRHVQGA